MTDPYQVLGVTQDASDEELKKAYRSLSRRFHPDANIDNPHRELAEAKFKEVQQAYQQIMQEREYGSTGNTGGFAGQYSQSTSGASDNETLLHMRAASNFINSGHYAEALNLLGTIADHSSQWYYLSAIANSGLGNNVIALDHAREAMRMEPGNPQYQMLVSRFESGGAWYRTQQGNYGGTFAGGNSLCMKLCIANLACNLCCGSGMCYGGGTPTGYM